MAVPTGAKYKLTMTIQSSSVDTTLTDWMTLLCVCDMGKSINTIGQSFVAGLESDLSDLEVHDASGNVLPWRRADASTFDQTVGSERLWIYVNPPVVSQVSDTEITLYRGCSAPVGEDTGVNVVHSDARFYLPLNEDAVNFDDWSGNLDFIAHDTPGRTDGIVGYGQDCTNGAVMQGFLVTNEQDATINMWGEFPESTDSAIDWMGRGTARNPQFQWIPSTARFLVWFGGSAFSIYGWSYAPGWHQMTLTFAHDTGSVRFLVDGVDYGGITSSFDDVDRARICVFGRTVWNNNPTGACPHPIDEVFWLNRVLSESELSTNHSMISSPATWAVAGEEISTLEQGTSDLSGAITVLQQMTNDIPSSIDIIGHSETSIPSSIDIIHPHKLRVELRTVDASGVPSDTVLATSDPIPSEDVNRDGFFTFEFPDAVQVNLSSKYAVVLTEEDHEHSDYEVGWVRAPSTVDYAEGNALIGNTWLTKSGDQIFKVYYDAPTETTTNEHSVTFDQEDADRWFVSVDNSMELDMRFMISFCIDATGTMAPIDPNNIRRSEAYLFAREVMRRAPYSYVDVWVFGDTIQENTAGGPTQTRQIYSAALGSIYSTGSNSRLWAAVQRAVGNTESALAVDAIVRDGEIEKVLDLMRQMNRIDYTELESVDGTFSASDGFSAIIDHGKATDFLVQGYADTMGRLGVVMTDGFDTVNDTDPDDVAILADAVAGDDRTPIAFFSLGDNHWSEDMLSVAEETGGMMCQVGENLDRIRESFDYLLNDEDDTIFQGAYEDSVSFDELTFVESIELGAIIPSTSTLTFEISVTYDGETYESWEDVPANSRHTLKRFIWGFKFRIRGWLGNVYGGNYYDLYGFDVSDVAGESDTVGCRYSYYYVSDQDSSTTTTSEYYYYRDSDYPSPRVYSLKYWTVDPATTYNFTELKQGGPPFEYLLAPTVDLPPTARLRWGIVRGDSTDFADAETAMVNRRGVLPNRVSEIYFTPDVTRVGLKAVIQDQGNVLYRVYNDDGTVATWEDTDEVTVYSTGAEIDVDFVPYQLDGDSGFILFNEPRPSGDQITVDILTPGSAQTREGEICTSTNQRTYTAKNGGWAWDAEATVRVNGAIKRDGYILSPQQGTVFFLRELDPTDEVALEITHPEHYRIAYELKSYDEDDPVDSPDFGMMFTEATETDTLFWAGTTTPPEASNVTLLPAGNSSDESDPDAIIRVATNARLVVDYDYSQEEGNAESDTEIEWYVKRSGETGFTRYDDYEGRNVQRTSEVTSEDPSGPFREGDHWYVKVTPSDANNTGDAEQSNTVLISDSLPPYVTDATVTAVTGDDALTTDEDGELVALVQALVADYTYVDPNLSEDQTESDTSVIEWYKSGEGTPSHTGSIDDLTLPSSMLSPGDVWYYLVTPYDGINYGTVYMSDEVTITREEEATTDE